MRKKRLAIFVFCKLVLISALLAQVPVIPVKINNIDKNEIFLGAFQPHLDKLLISPRLANHIQKSSSMEVQEVEGHHDEKGSHHFVPGCIVILKDFQIGQMAINNIKAHVTDTLNTPLDERRISANSNDFIPGSEVAELEFGLLKNQLDLAELMKYKAFLESNYKDGWPLSKRQDYYYVSDPPFPSKIAYAIYENSRFGYTLFYPYEFFIPERGPENGDGMGFSSEIFNASISTYGGLRMSQIDAKTEAINRFDAFRNHNSSLDIQYSLVKANWFVVSGLNDQGKIFYIKEVITDESILTISISYPRDYKEVFDEVVRMNGKCFPDCNN